LEPNAGWRKNERNRMREIDLAVIGGGAAGLAAGIKARELGVENLAIFEWNGEPGGILNQCIHPGFGLDYFDEELTGPEYAERFISKAERNDIPFFYNSTCTSLSSSKEGVEFLIQGPELGVEIFRAKSVIITTGCRERGRYNLNIPGDRCAGVYTAGTAQELMDIYGLQVGREIIVLGSGDIGMIMARRFAQEGARVKGVFELLPYPGGLTRNVVQCLEDWDIPLNLSTTVTRVNGKGRVRNVEISKVDKNLRPIPQTAKKLDCDALILSVGLIPDWRIPQKTPQDAGIEIDPRTGGPVTDDALETSLPNVFAAGNFLVVNDLVDDVSKQGEIAGENVALNLTRDQEKHSKAERIAVAGKGIRFVVPQRFSGNKDVEFYMRVKEPKENVRINLPELERNIFKTVVRPPEMVKVKLKAEDLEKVDKLTFDMEEKARCGRKS
jgi:NADPH-dependent 2,4-dienoyl-CoA reductase/sulfur reductase-like enzyme